MDILTGNIARNRWHSQERQALLPFQQSRAYGAAVAGLGAGVEWFEFREGGRCIAVAQALRRRLVLPVTLFNRGPIWLDETTPDQRARALNLLRRHLTGLVLITPPDGALQPVLAASGFRQVMTPTTLALLSLQGDIRAGMHGKWRNRLTKAERAGLQVRRSREPRILRWLVQTEGQQQRARGYRGLPASFTEAWVQNEPKNAIIFLAGDPAMPMAAMLFLLHGATATYHTGWTGDAGRALSAHHLILWRACQHFQKMGLRSLDLGIVDTENAPGLARFKLGAGATPVQTGGTWLGW